MEGYNYLTYAEKIEKLFNGMPTLKDKLIVVKISGALLDQEHGTDIVLQDIVLLKKLGMKIILIHGGGASISRMVREKGGSVQFVKGLRVTDKMTMAIVEEELSKINERINSYFTHKGIQSKGFCGINTPLFRTVKKKFVDESGQAIDLGYVGEIQEVNPWYVQRFKENSYIPVVAPVGVGDDGTLYNINADTAAERIAAAVGAHQLFMLSEVRGVYYPIGEEKKYVDSLTPWEIQKMMQKGYIKEGMIPKLHSCIEALKRGVQEIWIAGGNEEHILLRLALFGEKAGTKITAKGERMQYGQ